MESVDDLEASDATYDIGLDSKITSIASSNFRDRFSSQSISSSATEEETTNPTDNSPLCRRYQYRNRRGRGITNF